MLELLKKLEELRCQFLNRDHELLDLAEKQSSDTLQEVAQSFISCAATLNELCKNQSQKLDEKELKEFKDFCKSKKEEVEGPEEKNEEVTEKDLEAVAALAEEFSKSNDTLLRRQASVLDQVLLTFAVQEAKDEQKKAYDAKIAQIKENLGKDKKETVKQSFKADEVAKVVDENIKEYRPLETPLKTRSCTDHPGHQLIRISDDVYQCSLDKKTYDFKSGYTTLKGNKVPGGDVALQSHMSYTNTMSFNQKK